MAINNEFQWSSDPQMALRMQLAQGLMQGQRAPAQGFGENAANLGSRLIGAYMAKKVFDEGKGREQAKNDTLANALRAGQGQAAETKSYGDGTTINWDERKGDPSQMAAILAGNRDTSGMGMQMQIGQMDEDRKNKSAMASLLLKNQMDRENEFYKPIKTEAGSIIVPAMMPGFQMPGQAPRAPTPAPQAPGGGVDMRTASAAPNPPPVEQQALSSNPPPVEQQAFSHTPGYATQVTGVENGTGNPAARNPRSSAMGNGQFIDATWLDVMKRNRPDIVQGKSDQDILALRADPKLSAEMTDVYGMENADALRAGGIQNVGNAEKYAAHFFGPTGALRVLQADPNASFASVLSPEVIKANPQLARMTVGQWREQNAAKFGGGGSQPAAAPPAPVAPPANTALADALSPGTLYQGKGKGFRLMTPEEVKQNGLPPGFVGQIDRNGQIHKVANVGEGGGPFGGTSLPAQDSNILVNGDPASQEYALAYMRATETKFIPTQDPNDPTRTVMTAITPKLPPNIRPPAHLAQGAATPQPQAAPTATDTVPNPLQTPATAPPAPAVAAPDSRFTVTPIPGTGSGGKPSNEQNLNAGFANRLNASNGIFDSLETEGYVNPSLKDRAASHIPVVGGYLESNNFQKMDQAQREFINAQLRRESGAAISPAEFDNANRQYFPQPGDGPDVLAQKRASREMALANMAQSAGPAELGFKPKPAPKAGDKPTTPTTIMRFDAEGNIVQ